MEMMIPPDKCGLIIGKGGNTLKTMMQEHSVKLHLVQVLYLEIFQFQSMFRLGFSRSHKRRKTIENNWHQTIGE